ncbi:DUF6879 family protein [Streptomyces sp. NPDC102283]|uniref:DUF6879 family protein n=1 Tax=Streptomyces sp. NPDC102283 TaxID=3366155 RepID=UPI0037FD02AA
MPLWRRLSPGPAPFGAPGRIGLPDHDFWWFDSSLVARFVFGENDTTLGVILSEDPAEVAAACQARDASWHHATRGGSPCPDQAL